MGKASAWHHTQLTSVCAPFDRLESEALLSITQLSEKDREALMVKKNTKQVFLVKSIFCKYITAHVYPELLKSGHEPPLSIIIDLAFLFFCDSLKDIEFSLSRTYPLRRSLGLKYCQLINNSINQAEFSKLIFEFRRQRWQIESKDMLLKINASDVINFIEIIIFQWYEKKKILQSLQKSRQIPPEVLDAYIQKETAVSSSTKSIDSLAVSTTASFLNDLLFHHSGDNSPMLFDIMKQEDIFVLTLANRKALGIDLWLLQKCRHYIPFELEDHQKWMHEYLNNVITPVALKSSVKMPGGNNGIAKKGNFETVLKSQLARPDFEVRYLLRQLLYFDRSAIVEEPRKVLVTCVINVGEDHRDETSLVSETKLLAAQTLEDIARFFYSFSTLEFYFLITLHNGNTGQNYKGAYTLLSGDIIGEESNGLFSPSDEEEESWIIKQRTFRPFYFFRKPPWEHQSPPNWHIAKKQFYNYKNPFSETIGLIPTDPKFYNLRQRHFSLSTFDLSFVLLFDSGEHGGLPDEEMERIRTAPVLRRLSEKVCINFIRQREESTSWLSSSSANEFIEIEKKDTPDLQERFNVIRNAVWSDFANQLASN